MFNDLGRLLLDIKSSGAETRDPGIVSPSLCIFSSSHRNESEETAEERNQGIVRKRFDFSFCWRRALGVSKAKPKVPKAVGRLLILL
jgi:hypothetical protein